MGTMIREKFSPTFLKLSEEETLLQLEKTHHALLQITDKIAEYPANVVYPHSLVPHSKISHHYVKIIHTNEFKVLPGNCNCDSAAAICEILTKLNFVSYIEAGNIVKNRIATLEKNILDYSQKDNLDHPAKAVFNKEMASSIEFSPVNQVIDRKSFVECDEVTVSANILLPSTKQSVPKPRVFEIREYISESGSTSNEVVDITHQLEAMEKIAVQQPETGNKSQNEDDEFVRELAMIRGRIEDDQLCHDRDIPFNDEGLEEMFAKLEDRSQKPFLNANTISNSHLENPPSKVKSTGWKVGFLSSIPSKSVHQKWDKKLAATSEILQKSSTEGQVKRNVQFATVSEIRTIDTESTVSMATSTEVIKEQKSDCISVDRNDVDPLKGKEQQYRRKGSNNQSVDICNSPKPIAQIADDKQILGPRSLGLEKSSKPVTNSIVEKEPVKPKPMITGKIRF